MFPVTEVLAVSIGTDRTCTVIAIPTAPAAVTLLANRAVVVPVNVPTHVTRAQLPPRYYCDMLTAADILAAVWSFSVNETRRDITQKGESVVGGTVAFLLQ